MFGNYKILNNLRSKRLDMDALTGRLSDFQDEVSFLLNTLFSVFLRLTFALDKSRWLPNSFKLEVLYAFEFGVATC